MTVWTEVGFWAADRQTGGSTYGITIPVAAQAGDLVYVTAHRINGNITNIDEAFTIIDNDASITTAWKIIDGTEVTVTWTSDAATNWAYTLVVFRPDSGAAFDIMQQLVVTGTAIANGTDVLSGVAGAMLGDGLLIGSATTSPNGAAGTVLPLTGGDGVALGFSTSFRWGASSMSFNPATDMGDIDGIMSTSGGITADFEYVVYEFSFVNVVNDDGGDQGFDEYWDVLSGSASDALDTTAIVPVALPDLSDTDDAADTAATGVTLGWTGSEWGPLTTLDGGGP